MLFFDDCLSSQEQYESLWANVALKVIDSDFTNVVQSSLPIWIGILKHLNSYKALSTSFDGVVVAMISAFLQLYWKKFCKLGTEKFHEVGAM